MQGALPDFVPENAEPPRAARQPGVARFLASKQSRTTHATIEALDACELFAAILVDALRGLPQDRVLRPRIMQLAPNTLAINGGEWRGKHRDDLRSSAYVIDTLDAALWSVGTTGSFEEAVLTAVNLGGDPAGVAAVAGQLAGALYGAASIPAEWRVAVAWSDRLTELARDLVVGGATSFPARTPSERAE
jgi:ADP-ribosyl-[dinitrogen reductase] hydrolase